MSGMRFGVLGALLALSACGRQDSGLPAMTLLTPEGVNHKFSAFSPDGQRVAYWVPGDTAWIMMVAQADLSSPRAVASSRNAPNWLPVWSPDGSKLAFGSSSAGVMDVGVVAAEGGEVRMLTQPPAFNLPIQWHPLGDRVGYLATSEAGSFSIKVASLATGRSAQLLSETRAHVGLWSPDGSRVAYFTFDRGQFTLWVSDSSGNAKQLTTEGQESFDLAATTPWSPDGSQLIYISRRTGTADIWVLPLDGGSAHPLTRDIRDDYLPSWSPDGQWVAFISRRGRQTDVWVVPAAGGPELRVTDDAAEEDGLRWIGKSSRLAFHTGAEDRGLWAIATADGQERRITPDSIRVGVFDVSPVGNEVVYQVHRGGGVSDLQVASLEGGPPRTLVSGAADNADPVWSPDGKHIAFRSNRAGNYDVWVVAAAGGEPRQLVSWPTEERNAAWTADGSTVYFVSDREASPVADVWSVPVTGGEPRRVTSVGSINTLTVSRNSPDIFVSSFGGPGGALYLARVLPNGKLETLWDKSTVFGVSHYGFTPGGDTLAIVAGLPEGGQGSFLISTRTGQGRRILGPNELAGDFSRDGTQLTYVFGSPNGDLGLYSTKDGSTRRLTNSPDSEQMHWWTADGKTVVVLRSAERRRIATVDLTELLRQASP